MLYLLWSGDGALDDGIDVVVSITTLWRKSEIIPSLFTIFMLEYKYGSVV